MLYKTFQQLLRRLGTYLENNFILIIKFILLVNNIFNFTVLFAQDVIIVLNFPRFSFPIVV